MSAARRGMLRPPPPPPKLTFPSPTTCKNQTLSAAPGTPFPPCFYLNLSLLPQAPENKPSSGNNKFPHFQFAVFLPAAPVSPLSSRATLLITEAAALRRGIDGEGGSIQISAASPHKSLPGTGLCFPKPWWGGGGGGRAGDPDAADSSGLIAFGSVIYWSFLPSTSEELQEHHEHGQPFSWEFRGKKVVIFRGCVDMRYEPQVHL